MNWNALEIVEICTFSCNFDASFSRVFETDVGIITFKKMITSSLVIGSTR